MRDGVFTQIIYQAQGVAALEVTRRGLIIGPPVRTEVLRRILVWEAAGEKLYVGSGPTDPDYETSQIIRPLSDDVIVNAGDIKFYLSKADGNDQMEMKGIGAPVTLSDISGTGSLATATASAAHNYTTGDTVRVHGSTTFDGIYVITVTTTLEFTFAHTSSTSGETGTAEAINKLLAGVVVAPADYKVQTRTELDELSQDHALVMKVSGGDTDEVDITAVAGSSTEFDIADHTPDTALADGILNVAYGQGFRDGSGNYAKVIAVNVSSGTIRVKKVDVGFGASSQETGWDILYDYLGETLDIKRRPLVSMTITANRPSITGKYNISTIDDLIDMFGRDSVENPDSILAFDAFMYLTASKCRFSIYALGVDDSEVGKDIALDVVEHERAQSYLSGVAGYFIIPCYRAVDAADVTAIQAILSSYKDWVISRSGINSKMEGILYGAMPILNMGWGYTDATGATPVGLDLSDKRDTLYINCGTDSEDDVDNAVGLPNAFAHQRVVLLPFYGLFSTLLIEGSSVAAVVAGKRAALAFGKNLAYSTTWDNVPVITDLPSVEYYDETQLDALKDAGWQMLSQLTPSDQVVIYHQMTTSVDILEKKEEHLVIATDACAQSIRVTLKPFVARGIENQIGADPDSAKTVRFLRRLNAGISGVHALFVTENEIFADLKILAIHPNEQNRDQADIEISISYYYPTNRINVKMFII